MISLQNISKQYGGQSLFKDLSLHIGDGDRIAFVGPNGAGKSTLMKIITGNEEADSGKITRPKTLTTGYLPQDNIYHKGNTLYEEMETVFEEVIRLHTRIEEIGSQIASMVDSKEEPEQIKGLIRELEKVQHSLEHQKGYTTKTKIEQVLFGLGFGGGDLTRMTEEFSGGWQMRMEIAKLLLTEPSVLLLDEPTNHLDMDSLEWLENYLKSYKGSIILVSHDSRFLDNMVERIIEISQGKTTEYRGNYSSYIIQKKHQADILRSTYANQQKFIQKTARFIERFRYKNTKAQQVQSRIKMLEKMEKIDIDTDEQEISFHFPEPPYTGRIIMELEGINKAYGKNRVFKDLSLHIERGEKIAILGANGSGKSTLARIIAGIEPFQKGKRTPAKNTVISYYSQNTAEELDNNKTVFDTLNTIAPQEASERLRTLLGCFLFTEDDVFKPVKVLSGGEKSRLALARMLLNTANLLILDEPTNHLDIRSKAILQEGLEQYTGSCIIISHDRDFLAPITDKIFSLTKEKLECHSGNIDEYLEKCHREKQEETLKATGEKPKPPAYSEKNRKREEAERRQELFRHINPLQAAQDKIEREIEEAEQDKVAKEAAFSEQKTYESEGAIRQLNIEYAEVSSRLETLYRTWAELDEKIDEIKKEGKY